MYRIIIFFAFIICIVWLYKDPSLQAVVTLLLTVAGFFRDDIHGMIGRNIFRLTPKSKLIRDINAAKYSFINSDFINPRILHDLIGWLSDTGNQIASISITDSNKSNRYFGDIDIKKVYSGYPLVTCTDKDGWVSYKYIGRSFSGLHIVQTWSNSGGSGVFCDVVLVTLSLDYAFEADGDTIKKKSRHVIKIIGSFPLGDRYDGEISYKFSILTIPACNGRKTLRNKKFRTFVL